MLFIKNEKNRAEAMSLCVAENFSGGHASSPIRTFCARGTCGKEINYDTGKCRAGHTFRLGSTTITCAGCHSKINWNSKYTHNRVCRTCGLHWHGGDAVSKTEFLFH